MHDRTVAHFRFVKALRGGAGLLRLCACFAFVSSMFVLSGFAGDRNIAPLAQDKDEKKEEADKPKEGGTDTDADKPTKENFRRLFGTVQKLTETKMELALKEGQSGTWEIELAEELPMAQVVVGPISELANGVKVHLLARRAAKGWTDKFAYMQIQVMIAGEGYNPPKLLEKFEEKQMQWYSGSFSKKSDGTMYYLDGLEIYCGKQADIVIIKDAERKDLKKSAICRVTGFVPKKDKKLLKTLGILLFDPAVLKENKHKLLFDL